MAIEILGVNRGRDLDLWYELYIQIFTNPEDFFSRKQIAEWFKYPKNKYYLIYLNKEPIGIRCIGVSNNIPVAFVFYGGIIQKYRGQGIYPTAINIHNQELAAEGIEILLNDCENPREMDTEDEKMIAIARLGMFVNKLNSNFVDTTKMPYLRPAPPSPGVSYEKAVQDYIMLGFIILDPNQKLIKIKGNTISGGDYKKIYLYWGQLEPEIRSEKSLRKNIKAADEFLTQLDPRLNERFGIINKTNWTQYVENL